MKKLNEIEIAFEYFTKEAKAFALGHPLGCTTKELAEFLKIPYCSLNKYIVAGRIKVYKEVQRGKFRYKYVYFVEMCRVIDLVLCYITLCTACKLKQKSYELASRFYAPGGVFGPLKENLSKEICIHKKVLADFDKRWAKARVEFRAHRGIRNRFLANDEVSLVKAIELTGLSRNMIYESHRKGYFRSRKNFGLAAVKVNDLKDFICQIAANETTVKFTGVESRIMNSLLAKDKCFVRRLMNIRFRINLSQPHQALSNR